MQDPKLEDADQACRRLNVSNQTLYAYVSRGLIQTAQHPEDSRRRLYVSADIDHLVYRQKRGRSRQAIARSTVDFGEPVFQSKISSIETGQFFYRRQNAVALSREANLEDVFELLCKTSISRLQHRPKKQYISEQKIPFARFIDAMANDVTQNATFGNKRTAYRLLMLMACNAAQVTETTKYEPIHLQLAKSWTLDPQAPDLIRRALVLSADHELNASTYACRVTA